MNHNETPGAFQVLNREARQSRYAVSSMVLAAMVDILWLPATIIL